MKKTRTEHNVYAAWDYELELEALNQKSRDGWQLIKGGCFYSKFEHDDSVQYRYQMDFHPRLENRMRYVETFREQGWEYVNSTLNGWHFFRKMYDPSLPESEYEIYSDRPSREEMAGRLARVLAFLCGATLGLSIVMAIKLYAKPEWARVGLLAEFLTMFLMTLAGWRRVRAVGRGLRPKRRFPIAACIVLIIAAYAMFVGCSAVKPGLSFESSGFETTISVRLPDSFYLTASSEGEAAIQLLNAQGEPVYALTGAPVEAEDVRIPLSRGEYTLQVECAQGGLISVELN